MGVSTPALRLDSGWRLRRQPNWELSGTENLPAGCSDTIQSTCPFLLQPKGLLKYILEVGGREGRHGLSKLLPVSKIWKLLEQNCPIALSAVVGMLQVGPSHSDSP